MLLNIIKPSIIANQLEITVSVFMLLITLRLTNCFVLLIPFLKVIPLADKSKSNVNSPFLIHAPTVQAVFFSFARTLQIWTLRFARILLIGSLTATSASAQVYAGVLGGVATLSGDARSVLSPSSTAFSSYDPRNGGAVEVLVGRHLSDYFTIQGNYIWNGNGLTITSAALNNGIQQAYRETRHSSQQSLIGDVLVYFRNRNSQLRPYLSVGTGVVHFTSSQERIEQVLGRPDFLARRFSANMIALHVPVGIDVRLGKGWAFRYTFSETLSKNPISDRLSPPGQHSLKNFQNLFGFVRQF